MNILNIIYIRLRWKFLRWIVRTNDISFKKFMARMYWIQELAKLNKYDKEKLMHYSYDKTRKLYIKEYSNAYLHNPYKDK